MAASRNGESALMGRLLTLGETMGVAVTAVGEPLKIHKIGDDSYRRTIDGITRVRRELGRDKVGALGFVGFELSDVVKHEHPCGAA